MNVRVMSRADAVRYCHQQHETEVVMISVSDPSMQYNISPFRSEENKVRSILRLWFSDADEPGRDVYGNVVGEEFLMSDEDANQIARFLRKFQDADVLVHCDAGISRSSGIAAAILRHYTGDDSAVFDNPKYYPNMWCYRKVLTALRKGGNNDRYKTEQAGSL